MSAWTAFGKTGGRSSRFTVRGPLAETRAAALSHLLAHAAQGFVPEFIVEGIVPALPKPPPEGAAVAAKELKDAADANKAEAA